MEPNVAREEAVEAAMLERIEAGELFEDIEELSPRYKEILKQTCRNRINQ